MLQIKEKIISTPELIPFFMTYLEKHSFYNTHFLSKTLTEEIYKITWFHPSYHQLHTIIAKKIGHLTRKLLQNGNIERFNAKTYKILDTTNIGRLLRY